MAGDEAGGPRLGARPDADGVAFGLFSRHATAVQLCLFDGDGREARRVDLARSGESWHGHVGGIGPGQHYGYRVIGPWDPRAGHRFNPAKLLIDPYARALAGAIRWDDATFGYDPGSPDADLARDGRDSAPFVPRSVVTSDAPPAPDDRPRRPWRDTVIYEAHVGGLTRLHPAVPAELRGTFSALGHETVVAHLLRLGVTAVELLPVQAFVDDRFLIRRGLRNYWGYSPIAFFAPEGRYLGPDGAEGLKVAVRTLHAAGIEVILDVVYNHTAEADELGPTLSFRGIDNASYYRLRADDPRYDVNNTGCGNTLNMADPWVTRLALDSLRHWAVAYGIDGFRFDLAPALARNPDRFDPRAPFLEAVARDPLLASLKLIAEPWDTGEDGYRLGGFPPGWSEWCDVTRDVVRGFWRGDGGVVPRLARGLAGSREVFEPSGRGPQAAINYVCSHDGFTLRDLVSYERRHNEANGEGNRDGHGHNLSANGGVEGDTDDPAIGALRRRQMRNLLSTAVLSQGVPMLLMGDELGRTQRGNNNAYCQDDPTSWMNWDEPFDPELTAFVAALLRLRRERPAFRRTRFLSGAPGPDGSKDVRWLAPDGAEMTGPDWDDGERRAFGMDVAGDALTDGRALLLFNAGQSDVAFRLPRVPEARPWAPLLDTTRPDGSPRDPGFVLQDGGTINLPSRSIAVFGSAD